MANQINPTQKPDNQQNFSRQTSNQADGGVPLNSDDAETSGEFNSHGLMNRAEEEIRENEDASLQDDTYTFDSDNTDNEEGMHDVDVEDAGGGMSDFDLDNSDDFV